MLLRNLFEAIARTGQGKTAVVGWGRGMGHKGHMMLASSVITKAKAVGGDPYFVVSRTVGADDPITPDEKLAIYKKVFPEQGHIFQAASDELPDLTKVLANLNQQGYTSAVVVVGADQVKAFQYLHNYNGKPNKAGDIPFKFDSLEVISRQETGDPSAGEEGPRATPMRDILKDPSASPEQQFKVWRDAMSPEVSDNEVRDLMAKAKERMAQFAASKKKTKEEAGVGVIASKKQAKDPRYSMSLTKDVRPGQILKSLKAFKLAEKDVDENDDIAGGPLKNKVGGKHSYAMSRHDTTGNVKEQDVSEKMMPKSAFAGTGSPWKHKLGPAAQAKGKQKGPVKRGQLVGDAEESVEKKQVPLDEHWGNEIGKLIEKIIVNEAIQNKNR